MICHECEGTGEADPTGTPGYDCEACKGTGSLPEEPLKTLVPYGTSETAHPLPTLKGLGVAGRREIQRVRRVAMKRHRKAHREVYIILFRRKGATPIAIDRQYSVIRQMTFKEATDLLALAYIHQVEKGRKEAGYKGDAYWIFHPNCNDALRSQKSKAEESA